LQERFPHHQVLVTNMTPTGAERCRALLGSSVARCYVPYDLPGAVKRFLERVQPTMLIIIDTELWPNMIHYSSRQGVKITLANGRLSEKSARGYARISGLTRLMLNEITRVAVQTEQHGERFRSLGLENHKLSVTGSIKFDLTLPTDLPSRQNFLREKVGRDRLVLIAASTHQGEEEIVLDVFSRLQEKFPELLLVLVPRHPERFEVCTVLSKSMGLQTINHSMQRNCESDTDVLLVDAMGELIYFYSISHIAFIGGSLVPVGGHNMMEAAAFSLPIMMGPHLRNFDDIADLFVQDNAMVIVKDGNELLEMTDKLCSQQDLRIRMGDASKQVMHANRGALEQTIAFIEQADRSDGGFD
jgi:3-deoxy-D-manno-octulosonic-acid transferase